VTPARRDQPRRVTPELMAIYKRRAHELRAEACRNVARALRALLIKSAGVDRRQAEAPGDAIKADFTTRLD
jgi:hypothetical protein